MLFEAAGSPLLRGEVRKPRRRNPARYFAELERESGFAAAAVAPYKPHPGAPGGEARKERAVEVCGLELRRQHVFITYRSAHNFLHSADVRDCSPLPRFIALNALIFAFSPYRPRCSR